MAKEELLGKQGDYLKELEKLYYSKLISFDKFHALRKKYEQGSDKEKEDTDKYYLYILESYRNGVYELKLIDIKIKRIMLNVQFFFWLTIISIIIYLVIYLFSIN